MKKQISLLSENMQKLEHKVEVIQHKQQRDEILFLIDKSWLSYELDSLNRFTVYVNNKTVTLPHSIMIVFLNTYITATENTTIIKKKTVLQLSYYEKNKERIKEREKLYKQNNKERINEYHKEYRRINKEKRNIANKKRYEKKKRERQAQAQSIDTIK